MYQQGVDRARIQYMTSQMMATIKRYYEENKSQVKIQNVISGITVLIVPFMTNILGKYDEHAFHRAMTQTYKDEDGMICNGFDFIGDWKRNHALQFSVLVPAARMMRNSLNFNIDIATNLICDIIASWGWRLTFNERFAIRHLLNRIKRLIYS